MKAALGDDEVFITGEVFNGGVKVHILSYIAFSATNPLRLTKVYNYDMGMYDWVENNDANCELWHVLCTSIILEPPVPPLCLTCRPAANKSITIGSSYDDEDDF